VSNSTFPALPLLQRGWERTPFRRVDTFDTPSGVEQRSVRQTEARYRYSLRYIVRESVPAPAPWQAYSERAALQKLFDDHVGSWDSFLYPDPVDGVSRRVRFEEDELPMRQLVPGVYEVDVDLVSVIG
jgi:hypothetical protein